MRICTDLRTNLPVLAVLNEAILNRSVHQGSQRITSAGPGPPHFVGWEVLFVQRSGCRRIANALATPSGELSADLAAALVRSAAGHPLGAVARSAAAALPRGVRRISANRDGGGRP
eukprot:SAG31_NODE_11_length_38734_cov_21.263854_24_plen_116_part_00